MDKQALVGEFEKSIQSFRLPRSCELPELDFYMDQVISIIEKNLYFLSIDGTSKFITPAMINNYVKLGLIPPPRKKRYTKEHICYLFIICALKSVIAIPSVIKMIRKQTDIRSIYEVYDFFCEAYENMLKKAVETSRDIIDETDDLEEGIVKLSLFMSINAVTTQLIAVNALHTVEPEIPEEETEKEKEKGSKKSKE